MRVRGAALVLSLALGVGCGDATTVWPADSEAPRPLAFVTAPNPGGTLDGAGLFVVAPPERLAPEALRSATDVVHASWSPDGRYLAYWASALVVLDAEHDWVVRRVTSPGYAVWSPSGDRVASVGAELVLETLSEDIPPTVVKAQVPGVVWSPQGDAVAARVIEGEVEHAEIISVSGERRRLPELGHRYYFTWTPDGEALLVAASRPNGWDLWRVPMDGEAPSVVLNDVEPDLDDAWLRGGSRPQLLVEHAESGLSAYDLERDIDQPLMEGLYIERFYTGEGQVVVTNRERTVVYEAGKIVAPVDGYPGVARVVGPGARHLILDRAVLTHIDRERGAKRLFDFAPKDVSSLTMSDDGRFLALVVDNRLLLVDLLADEGPLMPLEAWDGGEPGETEPVVPLPLRHWGNDRRFAVTVGEDLHVVEVDEDGGMTDTRVHAAPSAEQTIRWVGWQPRR